ncbi:hypothetical protein [Deinococcus ruber]|uniref:Uncharacterized protein n=1 Tax=Deinococcus ruber TaxID=1848197 RepID=A0A918CA01_9DEIO|nr:hypothetical protein [Deinococcus ruber]GGR13346.1 hypothetical protein GCM10008957_27880 [Deinococcus ruber]
MTRPTPHELLQVFLPALEAAGASVGVHPHDITITLHGQTHAGVFLEQRLAGLLLDDAEISSGAISLMTEPLEPHWLARYDVHQPLSDQMEHLLDALGLLPDLMGAMVQCSRIVQAGGGDTSIGGYGWHLWATWPERRLGLWLLCDEDRLSGTEGVRLLVEEEQPSGPPRLSLRAHLGETRLGRGALRLPLVETPEGLLVAALQHGPQYQCASLDHPEQVTLSITWLGDAFLVLLTCRCQRHTLQGSATALSLALTGALPFLWRAAESVWETEEDAGADLPSLPINTLPDAAQDAWLSFWEQVFQRPRDAGTPTGTCPTLSVVPIVDGNQEYAEVIATSALGEVRGATGNIMATVFDVLNAF